MNKNPVRGGAEQGERAKDREALDGRGSGDVNRAVVRGRVVFYLGRSRFRPERATRKRREKSAEDLAAAGDRGVRLGRAGERVTGLLRRLCAGLHLRVNEAKSAVDRPQNRKLLGYSFWWGRGGEVKRRVAPNALQTMKDRVRELTRRSRSQSIASVVADLRSYLVGWKSYFRLADTPGVFATLDEWIRHRLRALHLKH